MVYALHLPAPQSPDGDRAALAFLLDRLPALAEREDPRDPDPRLRRTQNR
jgi:hypothetical protein